MSKSERPRKRTPTLTQLSVSGGERVLSQPPRRGTSTNATSDTLAPPAFRRSTRDQLLESVLDAPHTNVMAIEGAFACALVDYEAREILGLRNRREAFDIEEAALGQAEVMRTNAMLIRHLGLDERIADIVITLDSQCHIMRPVSGADPRFVYIVVDLKEGNIGLARWQLANAAALFPQMSDTAVSA